MLILRPAIKKSTQGDGSTGRLGRLYISDARLKSSSGRTKHSCSRHLQHSYQGQRVSVERFCSAKGICKQPKVTGEEPDAAVSEAVLKVSYTKYGDASEQVYDSRPAQ